MFDYNPDCELHQEDKEVIFQALDYTFRVMYIGCKWYWQVTFQSTYYGPYDTFLDAAKDIIRSEWYYRREPK